jgi:hypothetical protein
MGIGGIYKRLTLLILVTFFVAECGSINTSALTSISLNTPPADVSISILEPTTAPMPMAPAQPPTVLPTSPSTTGASTSGATNTPSATLPSNTPGLTTAASTTTAAPTERRDNSRMQIRIKTEDEDKVITATFNDRETARDFISLLPLSFTLEDYAGTEKIFYLPRKLATKDAPVGSDPSVGDIAYYAPWGNVAIYYKDFAYSNGLVILGKIDTGLEALRVAGSVKVTVELAGLS